MMRLLLFVLAVLSASTRGVAQDSEVDENETGAVLQESMLVEETSTSLILDNTRTKTGRDFYELFYREFNEAIADTAAASRIMAGLDPEDFVIMIEEIPAVNQGTVVTISINDQLIFQQFLQPRIDVVTSAAIFARESAVSYFESYQAIQGELQTKDMVGTGVY